MTDREIHDIEEIKKAKDGTRIVVLKCPECGAGLGATEKDDILSCTHCNTKVFVEALKKRNKKEEEKTDKINIEERLKDPDSEVHKVEELKPLPKHYRLTGALCGLAMAAIGAAGVFGCNTLIPYGFTQGKDALVWLKLAIFFGGIALGGAGLSGVSTMLGSSNKELTERYNRELKEIEEREAEKAARKAAQEETQEVVQEKHISYSK